MRVTFQAAHRETLDGINQASERMLDFQRQVATGKRIERPSDDPSAIAASAAERTNLANIDRYTEAGNSAQSRLTVADTVLSDLISQITAAQSNVLAASGSQVTPAQREALALELEALRASMLRDLNTQFRGQYVFGGAAGTSAPYSVNGAGVVSAYQGSATEVFVDVNEGHDVGIAFNGEMLTRGTDPNDLFVVMANAITAARAGDQPALNTAMADLDRARTRASTLQSRVGASLRTIDDDRARLSDAARASQTQIAALENVNMAEAISGMTEAETAYRAALGAAAKLQGLSLMDYLK